MTGAWRHFPLLIIVIPILAAVLEAPASLLRRRLEMPLACAALLASSTLTALLFTQVGPRDSFGYHLGSWPPAVGIEIRTEFITLFVEALICGVSLAVVFYSGRYARHEVPGGKIPAYYSLLLLMAAAMLGFVSTGDVFNLYIFMEVLAISSYALVAITGKKQAARASFKYLLMGAPASIIILLAIALLYAATGTLNMADLRVQIAASGYTTLIFASCVLFITGFGVKCALFPLHLWLPDAHSIAPSPVSAMLSGLVVKVGIFGLLRVFLTIFTPASAAVSGSVDAVRFIAAAAILYGGAMAILQRDFKMMIAYSTISHIGYIVLGLSLLNQTALTGAVYHIMDHGLAKACFFLCSGAFIYMRGIRRIEHLKGAGRQMPWTCAAFALAALSVVGIPPTAGFISKWYLVSGAVDAGFYAYAAVFLAGGVLAAFYCFRIIYYMFFQPPEEGTWAESREELPLPMLAPILVLSLATLVMGLLYSQVIPAVRTAAGVLLLP
jgi:multicomponent Na+:H+ antiporter subunit D